MSKNPPSSLSAQPLQALVLDGTKRLDPVSGAVAGAIDMVRHSFSTQDKDTLVVPVDRADDKERFSAIGVNTSYMEFLDKIVDSERLSVAVSFLESSPKGLSDPERKQREQTYGRNIAVDPMKVPPFIKLWLQQWMDFIVILLLVSGIVMAFLSQIEACVMITLILAANASVGAYMEYTGLKQLAKLINSEKSEVTAVIKGIEVTVDTRDLFPGDVILIGQGAKAPADCFVLKLQSAAASRSDASLNGESDPIELHHLKSAEEVESQFPSNALPAGSVMLSGTVLAMVYQTGKKTMAGQTQQSMAEDDDEDPETTKKVDALITKVGYVSLAAGVFVFGIGMITGEGGDPNSSQALWLQLLMISVSLIAAAVPEGLPVVKVIVMARAMLQMSANNAQMRSTKATENSAGITVLCSDKTGTLTEGVMSFVQLIVGTSQRVLHVTGSKPQDFVIKCQGEAFDAKTHAGEDASKIQGALLVLMNQCSVTSTFKTKSGEWVSAGSSNFIDIATSRFNASDLGQSQSAKFSKEDVCVDHPFDSTVKFAATVFRDEAEACYHVIVKGASDKPEFEALMTQADRAARDAASDEGLRLLALLTGKVPFGKLGDESEPDFFSKARVIDSLKFCGFAAFQDPPRQDAKLAIACCRDRAGIQVKMITGDNPRTALSIAKQIGICPADVSLGSGVLHMQDKLVLRVFTEFADLEQQKADAEKDKSSFSAEKQATLESHQKCIGHWITTRNVVARALPMHKRTIVKVLQDLGEIVAMTGDGVNDAAALKAAHLGVAMDNGADVTKEASDMVLRDNKFATIVNVAIRGGRVIGTNLKKFIYLLGSTNIAEVNIFIVGTFMGLPAPATPIMVLYLNLITDSVVALALGLEPPEAAVMDEAPEDPKAPLIGRAMWIRIGLHTAWSTALFIGYYVGMLVYYTGHWRGDNGSAAELNGARTCLIIMIVTSEMLRGYTAKSFDVNDWRLNNRLLNISVIVGIAMTIAIAMLPVVNDFFALGGTCDWVGYCSSLALSLTIFPVDMLLKRYVPRPRCFHRHAVVEATQVPDAQSYGIDCGDEADHLSLPSKSTQSTNLSVKRPQNVMLVVGKEEKDEPPDFGSVSDKK